MDKLRVRLIIRGRVQGVWFRESTRKQAIGFGVSGWVRNNADGTVELVAEGQEDRVKRLVAWCHEGPPAARVDAVDEFPEPWQGEFDSFDVAYY